MTTLREQYPERLALIAARLRAGDSLQAIGEHLGVSRERVRQLAKETGASAQDGVAIRRVAAHKERERRAVLERAKAERKCEKALGCSLDELHALNDGQPRSMPGTKAHDYIFWRKNVRNISRADCQITFPQWCALWDASGKWDERGRGYGYWLTRIDRTLPFTVDNVRIVTGSEAIKHHRKTTPWHGGRRTIHAAGD